jgi:hypothetical protein
VAQSISHGRARIDQATTARATRQASMTVVRAASSELS